MSVTLDELRECDVVCVANTEGGSTYYVDGKPLCLGYLAPRDDQDAYCCKQAGWGTSHPMYGRCNYHGGHTVNKMFITGRYNKWTKNRLREEYEDFITDPDLLNLAPELAVLRTILRETIVEYEYTRSPKALAFASSTIDNIGKMVERIEKIQSTHVLTAATARYMITKGMEVAKQYIPEEHLFTFIETWRSEVQTALVGAPIIDQEMDR